MPNGFKQTFLDNLSKFNKEDKDLFRRIYRVIENSGELVPPTEMIGWIESIFGNLEDVKKQDFLRISDNILYEGAIFNELRTSRPVVGEEDHSAVIKQIESARTGVFDHPLTSTPEDVFGRIKGEHCITASNVAKYDGLHGLIIYNEHDPLHISRKHLRDYFDVALKWFDKAHESDHGAVYPFYLWNCLWKSAASIIHGHAQLTLTKGYAYARVEMLRYLTLKYQERYRTNYFDDIYRIHESLGLAFTKGNIRIICKITPIKEKELLILSPKFNKELADVVSDTINTYEEKLGVSSFNLATILKPLEKTPEVWGHLPYVTRIVDRGKITNKTSDIGAMELYAQSVVGSNPYIIYNELHKALIKAK